MGLDSSSDLSDTQSTAAKKSGVHALGQSSANAPTTERAVMLTMARDADAASQLRHAQVTITESGNLYWAEENNGTLGNWQRAVSEDATQTLTNKTLTGAALNGTLGATTPAAASVTTLDTNGLVSNAGQSGFLVVAGAQANVTGAGTNYTVTWGTEVFDQNGDFASNTFTAPKSGRYFLTTTVDVGGFTAAFNQMFLKIVTSNRTYSQIIDITPSVITPGLISLSVTAVADMDLSDTAFVELTVSGEAGDICDVNAIRTTFSGFLLG